ncbi:hypothetical protein SAMN05444392_11815 [Seinonella peptonophila]|uniref:Uncharacterized protein n=1 Tax=Seinonella peptonophila TaxID=112248 RepID=A0A1M5B495_9BACL|nr:hypothetical protein [Seinonella peptonophila]SHF37268.1 hypothetical protein SAMN05444392_11815 [Seinonella peptonophila]
MSNDQNKEKPKRRRPKRDPVKDWLVLGSTERDLAGDEEGRKRWSNGLEALERDRQERGE